MYALNWSGLLLIMQIFNIVSKNIPLNKNDNEIKGVELYLAIYEYTYININTKKTY